MSTFSQEQISRTRNHDAHCELRRYKLDFMSRFMEVELINPKLIQKQIAAEISFSDSPRKWYTNDIKMQSHYKLSEIKNGLIRTQKPQKNMQSIRSVGLNRLNWLWKKKANCNVVHWRRMMKLMMHFLINLFVNEVNSRIYNSNHKVLSNSQIGSFRPNKWCKQCEKSLIL